MNRFSLFICGYGPIIKEAAAFFFFGLLLACLSYRSLTNPPSIALERFSPKRPLDSARCFTDCDYAWSLWFCISSAPLNELRKGFFVPGGALPRMLFTFDDWTLCWMFTSESAFERCKFSFDLWELPSLAFLLRIFFYSSFNLWLWSTLKSGTAFIFSLTILSVWVTRGFTDPCSGPDLGCVCLPEGCNGFGYYELDMLFCKFSIMSYMNLP